MTADRIRNAPNAKALNAMLPDDVAIIHSAKRLWTVQIAGQAMGFPESFLDARERLAVIFERREQAEIDAAADFYATA